MQIPIPENIRADAIRRVEQGETKAVVAKSIGVSKSTVWLWTQHIKSTGTSHALELKNKYLERVKNGEVPAVVARELGLHQNSARYWTYQFADNTLLSEETQQKIKSALEQGLLPSQIAKDLQISKQSVVALRRTSKGKSVRNRIYTDEEKQLALQMIASGSTIAETAAKIGVSSCVTIKNWHNAVVRSGAAKPYERRKDRSDKLFSWITRDYSHLEDWRESMVEWMAGETRSNGSKVSALFAFVKQYLDAKKLPSTRAEFLKRGQLLPDFYKTACKQTLSGVSNNNSIHDFLNWILLQHFSVEDDNGRPMVSPGFCNPLPNLSGKGQSKNRTSVREVLPYGFICIFRDRLAAGPNFKDWTLAQSLLGITGLDGLNAGNDWFRVSEDIIDKSDPDCVWRKRKFARGSDFFEMWSPVRWVLLLNKMQLTARTGQVRMADSGESDTWRYIGGQFILNTEHLAIKYQGRPWAQGVFRRVQDLQGSDTSILYFNNNKTADIGKDGPDKGQECPWPHLEGYSEDPYYWFEKLRNWQEKYNPIKRRVSWSKIPRNRALSEQSDVQKSSYPDSCFLFRTPETPGEEHLPISNGVVDKAWQSLMKAYEQVLAEEAIKHADGSPVHLIDSNSKTGRTFYPLHGNRVSLITAFIIEGGIDPVLMMKIVGHSRLIMTLYYTKPGFIHLQNAMMGAAEKLDKKKDESITQWLVSANANDIINRVVFNADNWQNVVNVNLTLRNPAGWYLRHDGICFAGGNTSGNDANVRGCHNGGPLISNDRGYGPVNGGIMNCSQCRWNAAEKHHGPALVATLNNQLYHVRIAQEEAVKHSTMVSELKKKKARNEASGTPFEGMKELKTAERLFEMTVERLGILSASADGTYKMIQRVMALPDDAGNGMVLAASGDLMTMNVVLEEVDSELLQLAGICGDVEIYPDLGHGKAVYRRSQILDAALRNHSLPSAFAVMSEEDQLIFGNAFMRNLARQADPNNPILGLRTVVSIIDQGESLEQILGVKLSKELASAQGQTAKVIPIRLKIENDNGKDQRTS